MIRKYNTLEAQLELAKDFLEAYGIEAKEHLAASIVINRLPTSIGRRLMVALYVVIKLEQIKWNSRHV